MVNQKPKRSADWNRHCRRAASGLYGRPETIAPLLTWVTESASIQLYLLIYVLSENASYNRFTARTILSGLQQTLAVLPSLKDRVDPKRTGMDWFIWRTCH